ncbi:hypothetical protein P154DRAFT_527342 [Amniculicola lignicola CBS 123094]|uniref:U6 small nuclear RNA (adenine-(43)-N(6))-methyltransferase n=1 Tax=Amniculicola lignicola CBS 123094 TaxID=1392246 RepID=A0A6A5W1K6_9PLEO|nr:hypothetical protein P154DRAFT_527342 [Amniculicola lignicola CBS 123094]
MKRKVDHHRNDSYTQTGPNKIAEVASEYIDFHDPSSVRSHNASILSNQFGLKISLPEDRLCPPIPNRLAYISWIQALIDSTSPNYGTTYDPNRQVIGLDIGTGASAIYSLLALQSRPNWTMCLTDIDDKSFEYATQNIKLNGFSPRVKMLKTTALHSLIPLHQLDVERLDFTLCNPPFFASDKEMQSSLAGAGKTTAPSTICTGSVNEMVTAGGDLGFVLKIVQASFTLQDKVQWYSSMFGKLSSAQAIIEELRNRGIRNWAVGSIAPGGSTRRWIVAWSFWDYRPRNDIARGAALPSLSMYLPDPTEYVCLMSLGQEVAAVWAKVRELLVSMESLFLDWDEQESVVVGGVAQNVWNRVYRKAKKAKMDVGDTQDTSPVGRKDRPVALVFRVRMPNEDRQIFLEWVRGLDSVLWISFCGWIHRAIREA